MTRLIMILVALMLAMPAAAQDTIADRLAKARTEVNTATNASARADTACSQSKQPKCRDEVKATNLALRRALYAIDKAIELAAPVPVPTPSPTPTPEGADFLVDFDISKGLAPSWGSGAIPGPYTPDRSEGAFRFTCGGEGGLSYDDPVVYPGKPGASHLHYIWGNTEFDAFTDGKALAANAETNCNYGPYSLNRSSYWMPALIHDGRTVIKADWIAVYYKRSAKGGKQCDPNSPDFVGICTTLPNDIRFVFGWDMSKPDAPVRGASWYCTGGSGGHFPNLAAVWASGCKAGDTLIANTAAPDCWNGKDLDAADHRSHMAYSGWYTPDGKRHCPAGYPHLIPQQENKAAWTVTSDMVGRVVLSSDHMKPNAKPGETLHADYIEKWDARAKAIWIDNCIDKGLDCSGGDMGNGQQLIGAAQPAYGWINPNPRVPVPSGGVM